MEENNFYVYKVTNTMTNQCYIGTTTKSIEQRKADHLQKSAISNGYKFQEAIGTYGPEAFQWEQIDTALTTNELACKEIKYISEYNSLEEGYNSDKGGGIKKTVYKYNLDGSLNTTFENLTSAGQSIGVRKQDISRSCWNVNHTLGGFLWSYDYIEPFIPEPDSRKKEVVQYYLDGNFVAQYISIAEASRKTGISKTCIARCCRGERSNSNGYTWNYS